ncbi:HupE/UreJ family protein [Hymenobacter cellulosivorans]|uniref:HupE/UreJ family protein n=1 Tax=Hymenobacter cellulosivorans TaxID=2932249 RepID=A0ABY4FA22_9BACT|nr:HupE/UreJ family protein [Hymenobacter cellulosivorans]UOQ53314.1 HupE/UreJ family protein [Hymenobacter cellulosivorans]
MKTLAGSKKLVVCAAVLLLGLLWPQLAAAHVLDVDVSKLSRTDIISTYLKLGYTHILPLGLDHILFVLSLYFLEPRLKAVLWQATAFTVAHSITLGMAMYGLISPPASIVEPIIALSILFVAIENIVADRLNPWRVAIVFGFGLIHGMGFASVLTGLGLPRAMFVESLISFNVGVELGQVTVILLAWLLVGRWFADKPWYKQRVVVPVSVLIGLVAAYWTVERVFFA